MFLLLSNQLLISQDLVSKEEAKTCPREAAPTTAYLSNAGTDSPIEHGIAHLYLPVIFCLQVRAEFWILSNCSIIPLFHFSIISTIPSFGKLSNALTASTGAPFALSFPKCLGFKMYFGQPENELLPSFSIRGYRYGDCSLRLLRGYSTICDCKTCYSDGKKKGDSSPF